MELDTSACDILVSFPSQEGISCTVELEALANGDSRVVDDDDADRFAAVIRMQRTVKWFFNPVDSTTLPSPDGVHCDGFEDEAAACD